MSDQLHDRGHALEGSFFRHVDEQLLQKLRHEMETQEAVDAMKSVSGVDDEAVLKELVEAGITPETMTSLAMVPLVTVAWADGKIQDNERTAILKAGATVGIVSDSASYEILEGWLSNKPGPDLLESWKHYIGSLKNSIGEAAFKQLKNKVIARANEVAESAGGFLGMDIQSISFSEKKTIAELEDSF